MKTRHYCFSFDLNLILFFLILSTLSFFHLVNAQPNSNSNSNNGCKITPMTVGIIVVALAFVTIIGWLLVYLKQIPRTSFYYTYTYSGKQGLDHSVIKSFPTFLYSDVKELKIGERTIDCSICLDEFYDENQTLRFIPKCYHVFHRECIDAWLCDHTTCPVCRSDLILDPCELTQEETRPRESELSASYEQVEIRVAVSPEEKMRLHRSKSMGDSVLEFGEDCEGFTVRLSDEPKLKRSVSLAMWP